MKFKNVSTALGDATYISVNLFMRVFVMVFKLLYDKHEYAIKSFEK